MDENKLIQQVLQIWQSLAPQGVWYQDAFLLFISMIAVAMLFFSGTIIGLLLQSLWGIFVTSHQQNETDS